MVPKRPHCSTLDLGEDTAWGSTTESSDDESVLDNVLHPLRVVWIDFDVAN